MSPSEFKARRLELGLTQSALARALGVTRQAVYQWETGRRRINSILALAMQAVKAKTDREAE